MSHSIPKHSQLVFALLPRTGLANRLFPWARAVLFAERHKLKLHVHGWGHIHPGPWIRMERSKRYYAPYLRPSSNHLGFLFQKLRAYLGNVKIIPEAGQLDPTGNRVYTFSEVPDKSDYFVHLRGHEKFLGRQLLESLRPKYQRAVKQIDRYPVAVHARRGDFLLDGRPVTSDEYFEDIIKKLKSVIGENAEVRLFSDADPRDLTRLLSIPNVKLATPKPDIVELIEISRAKIIVTSHGSSFGYWAGFISDADIILHPDHKFGAIRSSETCSTCFEGTIDSFVRQNLMAEKQPSIPEAN